jgi:hypothetical protein
MKKKKKKNEEEEEELNDQGVEGIGDKVHVSNLARPPLLRSLSPPPNSSLN